MFSRMDSAGRRKNENGDERPRDAEDAIPEHAFLERETRSPRAIRNGQSKHERSRQIGHEKSAQREAEHQRIGE